MSGREICSEKLEQLRVLENGYKIKMLESPRDSVGIDTPDDVDQAIRWINEH
jgi:3-deoxy-manno-octulosonate cytidylyltransferase (CMP-KDO synthetase)